jgi:hypothetical protein
VLLDLLPLEQPAAIGGGGAPRLSVHWPDAPRPTPDEQRDDELTLALLGAL